MMQRYEPKPWDIRRCDMVRADDGEYVRYDDARAEIERRGRELNIARYGDPDFSWSIHKEAMSELQASAEKAEAERDEARAQVAAAFVAAEKALESRKYGDPDEREEYAFDAALDRGIVAIRTLASDHAKAALDAYGREKVREGMQRAAGLFKDANHGEHIISAILAEGDAEMTDTRELVERYVMEIDSDFGDDAKAVPVPDPWGQWVRASDYAALSERNRALEEALRLIADIETPQAHVLLIARAALTSGGRG